MPVLLLSRKILLRGEVLKAKKASVLLKNYSSTLRLLKLLMVQILDWLLVRHQEENTRLGVAIGAGIAGLIILSNPIGLVAGALVPGKNITFKEGAKIYLEVARDTKVISLTR